MMRNLVVLSLIFGANFSIAAEYSSELVNFPGVKAVAEAEFDTFFIPENKLQVGVKFHGKTLTLQLTSISDDTITFLPLDVKLGTADNHCSIKDADFEKKRTLRKHQTYLFKYKFYCAKEPEAFLSINGLTQNNKKLPFNFRFLKK